MNTRITAAAVALITIALSGCTETTSAVPGIVQPPAQHTTRPLSAPLQTSPGNAMNTMLGHHINYEGGPVQRIPRIYVNYWGFNVSGRDPNGEQFYLTDFLAGIGGSTWLSDVTQYYEVRSGRRLHIQNNVGEMQGAWFDNTSVPQHPTDGQIQAAAKRLITHFGYSSDATYIVATPHNHNTQGFGTQFCAYHNRLFVNAGAAAYVNLPYISDAGAACFANAVNRGSAGQLDGVSILGGAMLAEAQTDPFFTAWVNFGGLEIGSDCFGLNLRDITLSTGKFAIQGLWSNKRSICSDSGP